MGGVRCCPSAADPWIDRTTSMPFTTRPKAANPWPSGLRRPPWSSDGWSPMQTKKSEVAVSGPSRAMETTPSLWRRPVTPVRSRAMGGNPSLSRAGLTPAWMTSILTVWPGWLDSRTVRWNPPSVVEAAVHVAEEVGAVAGARACRPPQRCRRRPVRISTRGDPSGRGGSGAAAKARKSQRGGAFGSRSSFSCKTGDRANSRPSWPSRKSRSSDRGSWDAASPTSRRPEA